MTNKVRVRLLNNGSYFGFENVVFPVEVVGEYSGDVLVKLPKTELVRIGADEDCVFDGLSFFWREHRPFKQECEVIDG